MAEKVLLLNTATGEMISYNANYPRGNENLHEPVQDLDPNHQYLVWYEPYAKPDYDSRIYTLKQKENVTDEPHPEYGSHIHLYKVTFETEKRPTEEIELNVENAENEANERICGDKFKKWVALSLTAIINNLDGITPKPAEKVVLDETRARGVKIWRNDNELRNKIQQLANGQEPEIDSGWEKEA